jgi:phospholipid/cholesterol/gamma-HCH transport system substrate-binding protein
MDDERLSVRVGGVVLVVIGIAAVLLLVLQGRHLRPGVRIEVDMARIGNLQVGAAVRLAGLTLGSVDDIRLMPAPAGSDHAHARLEVWLDRRHAHLARETTDFFVNQEGLLGESYLGVAQRPGEPGPPLAEGTRVQGVAPPEIDKLLGASYRNLQAITELLRDGLPEADELGKALDELEVHLGGLDAEPLVVSGRRLWAEARPFVDAGLTGGSVGASLRAFSATRARTLPALETRLQTVSDELARLGRRVADPRVSRLAEALNRAGELVAGARRAAGTAAALVELVESGQGSLGAFLADDELFDEMKDLSRIMKTQPWRTLQKD